jgi:hypothetical protein
MHIAASNPQAVDSSGLDPQTVAREKDILADKFRQQGKTEASSAEIVESGLKTFYKKVCLLDQPYIHDPGKSVAQALKEAEGKVGGAIKVTAFVRYALGEGIERPVSDFAADVAEANYACIGNCPVCSQGEVLIARENSSGCLFLWCEECDSEWRSPSDFRARGLEAACRDAFSRCTVLSREELADHPWREHLQL